MTKLTQDMFEELNIITRAFLDTSDPESTWSPLWFRLAIIAVTALVDIADSLADMAVLRRQK